MMRLFRYLKPYSLLVILSIVLLFIQANADLALPDYMSKIVNNGIQQGGIENAIPIAIRKNKMDRLVKFLGSENKQLILSKYTLVTEETFIDSSFFTQYSVSFSEPIYVRNEIRQTDIDLINPIIGKALLIVSSIEQISIDPTKAAAQGQAMGLDFSKIPPGMDVFSVLELLPASQLDTVKNALNENFVQLGDSLIIQMAVGVVKNEYIAIGMDTDKLQMNYIFSTGLKMLLVSLLSITCTIMVAFFSAHVASGMARDIRKDLFTKVESFSNAEFDTFSTASLITRSTNDVTQIQMVVMMMIRMVFYAPIIGVGGIIRALSKSTSMWWIIALAVIILLGLILSVFVIALPKFKSIQNLIDRLNLVMRENLSGMMVIRAFNMETFEENRFDKANENLTGISLFINRIMVIMMPVMMFVMNGVSLLIIWVGAHQVAESNMQVGDMMAFLQYAMQILFAFLMVSIMFIILPRASVSADRIADVIESKTTITDPEKPMQFGEPFKGTIEFRNVCFRYPNALEDVLKNINFTAKPGETTAFIGSTGSGKSTIVNLIPRFYDVTSGSILMDDIDIRDLTQHELREKIGYIPQKGTLFSGTIESNLRYADENASEEVIKEVLEISQASEFTLSGEDGISAEIAQGGSNVSGGQKQRLSIARALVKNAPIYIFDDSFSSLDFKTDAALRRALKSSISTSTVFIVSQRVSTIMNSDQIIVLDEGKVVGKGTHQELMESCEVYQDIALSQLSRKELS